MDGPVKTVIISGLELKAKDLTITDNNIWSRNTGRVASGDMEGDIKAKKIKLNLTLAPLDDEEAAAFSNHFPKSEVWENRNAQILCWNANISGVFIRRYTAQICWRCRKFYRKMRCQNEDVK